MKETTRNALAILTWSRVWSPIVPQDLYEEAWSALGLPDNGELRDTEFCSTFHAGFPAPPVPLLLHVALRRSSDEIHTDILRVMSHLGMTFGEHVLAPDHLAIVCEVFAVALFKEEPVIVETIRSRYLLPWCRATLARLDNPALHAIVERFAQQSSEATVIASLNA